LIDLDGGDTQNTTTKKTPRRCANTGREKKKIPSLANIRVEESEKVK
jgi:hypothetical protein